MAALFVQGGGGPCARGIPCPLRLDTVTHDCRHMSGCDERTRAHQSLPSLLSAYQMRGRKSRSCISLPIPCTLSQRRPSDL
jgi:hypothetical protein